MRGVGRAKRKIEIEGPLGHERYLISDHCNRLINQILREVIAVLRTRRLRNHMVVSIELGVKLIRFALHKAVEAIESSLERPVGKGPSGRRLTHRCEMPLAHTIGSPAVMLQ